MPSIAVIGMQWGDEGKGKVIDLLSEKAHHIARAQGGNNAGHTIVVRNVEYRFHLIPSGIVYPHTHCYVGGGVVLDPASFLAECDALAKHHIAFDSRLFVSRYAHVVMPYHKLMDQLAEKAKGHHAIGTTGKGIGPCYADKVNRCGIRIADLLQPALFRDRLQSTLDQKNFELHKLYNSEPLDFASIFDSYQAFAEKLQPFTSSVEEKLDQALRNQEKVLFEGAQGSLLDVTFGTYPFVTSSCTLAGGVCAGAGVGPSLLDKTIGVAKAYTTRVGNGPMPTELSVEEMRNFPDHVTARELGTTTGRKRRIGWLDTFLLRHSTCLNGVNCLAVTKLDILDQVDEIKICIGYKDSSYFPATIEELKYAEPVYETHPGWNQSTKEAVSYEDLPKNAQKYLQRIEELCDVPIAIISTGPEREKTLWLDRMFA